MSKLQERVSGPIVCSYSVRDIGRHIVRNREDHCDAQAVATEV